MKARSIPNPFPFIFNIGQRVRCGGGRPGTVRYRWNTDVEAIYLVEFDGDRLAVEMSETGMRPEMADPKTPEQATARPYQFEVGQKVELLAGGTGTVVQRWHSVPDTKYLVRQDGDNLPIQLFESALSSASRSTTLA